MRVCEPARASNDYVRAEEGIWLSVTLHASGVFAAVGGRSGAQALLISCLGHRCEAYICSIHK
jgi:hypothetical protein